MKVNLYGFMPSYQSINGQHIRNNTIFKMISIICHTVKTPEKNMGELRWEQ